MEYYEKENIYNHLIIILFMQMYSLKEKMIFAIGQILLLS